MMMYVNLWSAGVTVWPAKIENAPLVGQLRTNMAECATDVHHMESNASTNIFGSFHFIVHEQAKSMVAIQVSYLSISIQFLFIKPCSMDNDFYRNSILSNQIIIMAHILCLILFMETTIS